MAKRALIIANGRYEDPRFRPLPGAEADLYGLRAVLADPAVCGFEVEVVRNGRTDDIRIAIQQFFAAARRDDILLLHVSAHGRRDESRWYFAATNTRHEFLDATGVSFEYIDQRIERGLSRRVVVLLDCCYSGAATLRRTRGEPVADLSDQFNGRGRVVITSSTALQYAHEQDVTSVTPARPSVFTQAVITGLATGAADLDGDGFVSVDELYDYVHAEVTSRVPEQTPTRTADQVEGRLLLARAPDGSRARTPDGRHLRISYGSRARTVLDGGGVGASDASGARVLDGGGAGDDEGSREPLVARARNVPAVQRSEISTPVVEDPAVVSVARPPSERAGPALDHETAPPTVDHSSAGTSPGEGRSPVVTENPVSDDPTHPATSVASTRSASAELTGSASAAPTRSASSASTGTVSAAPVRPAIGTLGTGSLRRPTTESSPARSSPRLRGPVTPGEYGRAVLAELLAGLACGTLLMAVPMFLVSFYDFNLGPVFLATVLATIAAHLAIRGPLLVHATMYRFPVLLLTASAAGVLISVGPSNDWKAYPLLLLVGLLSALRQPITAGTFRAVGPAAHSLSLLGQSLGAVVVLGLVLFHVVGGLQVPSLVALLLYVVAAGLALPSGRPPGAGGEYLPPLTYRSRLLLLAAATAEFSWGATLMTVFYFQDAHIGVQVSDGLNLLVLPWTAVAVVVPFLLVGWLGRPGPARHGLLLQGTVGPGRPGLFAAVAVTGLLGQGILLSGLAMGYEFATHGFLLPGLTLFTTLTVRAASQALSGGSGAAREQFVLSRARGLAGGLAFLLVLYPELFAGSDQEQVLKAGTAIYVEAGFVLLVAMALYLALLLDRRSRADRGLGLT